jgi:hypothetical protein
MIAFARIDQDILVDKIPLTEIILVRNMANEQKALAQRRKPSVSNRGSFNLAGFHSQSSNSVGENGAHSGNEKKLFTALPALSSSDQPGEDNPNKPKQPLCRNISSASHDVAEPALSASFNNSEEISAALEGRGYINTLQIQTVSEGFNSGRTYYMRAETESMCWSIVDELSDVSQRAKKRAQARTNIMKLQKKTKRFYDSLAFQGVIGMFITMVSAAEVLCLSEEPVASNV